MLDSLLLGQCGRLFQYKTPRVMQLDSHAMPCLNIKKMKNRQCTPWLVNFKSNQFTAGFFAFKSQMNYNLRRTLSQGCLERCLVRGQSLDKTSMSTDAEKDSWKERELSKGFEKKRD